MKRKYYKVFAETASGIKFNYIDVAFFKKGIRVNKSSNIYYIWGEYKILKVKEYDI